MKRALAIGLALAVVLAAAELVAGDRMPRFTPLVLAQFTPLSFNAWRPYKNPNSIIQVGMNKGQVLAIAGKPDHEESYYQEPRGRLLRISDWYYVKTGLNHETALLKFSGDALVSISVTPIQ